MQTTPKDFDAFLKEKLKRHGDKLTEAAQDDGDRGRINGMWSHMKKRANKNNIGIAGSWLAFEQFYQWAHYSGYTKGLALVRIKQSVGFGPANCELVPKAEATKRRRVGTGSMVQYPYKGQILTVVEICALPECEMSHPTVYKRLKEGQTVAEAIKKVDRRSKWSQAIDDTDLSEWMNDPELHEKSVGVGRRVLEARKQGLLSDAHAIVFFALEEKECAVQNGMLEEYKLGLHITHRAAIIHCMHVQPEVGKGALGKDALSVLMKLISPDDQDAAIGFSMIRRRHDMKHLWNYQGE